MSSSIPHIPSKRPALILAAVLTLSGYCSCHAQTAAGAPPEIRPTAALDVKPQAPAGAPPEGQPAFVTTKILAIGSRTPKFTPDALRTVMPQEVRETLKLYLAGKIDQWYVKTDRSGVVFILNMTDVNEAKAMLAGLPLGLADLMHFDLIPIGPLAPLRLLASDPPK